MGSSLRHVLQFLSKGDQIYSMGFLGNGAKQFKRTGTISTERTVILREELAERMVEHRLQFEEIREGWRQFVPLRLQEPKTPNARSGNEPPSSNRISHGQHCPFRKGYEPRGNNEKGK